MLTASRETIEARFRCDMRALGTSYGAQFAMFRQKDNSLRAWGVEGRLCGDVVEVPVDRMAAGFTLVERTGAELVVFAEFPKGIASWSCRGREGGLRIAWREDGPMSLIPMDQFKEVA